MHLSREKGQTDLVHLRMEAERRDSPTLRVFRGYTTYRWVAMLSHLERDTLSLYYESPSGEAVYVIVYTYSTAVKEFGGIKGYALAGAIRSYLYMLYRIGKL